MLEHSHKAALGEMKKPQMGRLWIDKVRSEQVPFHIERHFSNEIDNLPPLNLKNKPIIVFHNTALPHAGSYQALMKKGILIGRTAEEKKWLNRISKGNLNDITRKENAHFYIDHKGNAFQIAPLNKATHHAGESAWNFDGKHPSRCIANTKKSVGHFAIGIEILGEYSIRATREQLQTVKKLVHHLMKSYHIPSERAVPHSMIAARFEGKHIVRGRKQLDALHYGLPISNKDSNRDDLGLTGKHPIDPEMKSGTAIVAPAFQSAYNALFSKSSSVDSRVKAKKTRVCIGTLTTGRTPIQIAGRQYCSDKLLYVFPSGKKVRGDRLEPRDFTRLPNGTKIYALKD